jgi:hypothetical protein
VVGRSSLLWVLGIFAALGYAVGVVLYIAPPEWKLSSTVVFFLCPAVTASFAVDSTPLSVLLLLAPLNAVIYSIVGVGCSVAYHEARTELRTRLARAASRQ